VRTLLSVLLLAAASAQAANNAAFVFQSVPTTMTPGQSYAVSITLQNTGTTTWSSAGNYRLGTQNPQDNSTWTGSARVALPQSVAPGQNVTFSFNVTAPATAGMYNFQWKMVQDGVEWFGAQTANVLVGVSTNPTTLSASPAAVPLGGSTTATWSAIPAPTAADWIGLYAPGAGDSNYLAWRYTTGTAGGSVPFSIPSSIATGNYELRLYANGGYTRLATSSYFSVTPVNIQLSVAPAAVLPGGSVDAQWSGIPAPAANDWLGLYVPSADNYSYLSWRYTTGAASGTVPFTIPAGTAPGTYELRLLAHSYLLYKKSNTFTVNATVSGTVTLNGAPLAGVAFAATSGGSCGASNGAGQYSCSVPPGWSGSVTPSLAGYSFTPASRSYTNVTANQTGQDFTATALAAATLYFVQVDHLNTPRLVANSSGTTVWRWDQQEPFGNNVADENPSGLGVFDLPLRLPGQYFDKETNLLHNYFRDYDPAIGRYGQGDPVGLTGRVNLYAYVEGQPLLLSDPLGLRGGSNIWQGIRDLFIKPREPVPTGSGVEGSGVVPAGSMARKGAQYGQKLCKGPSRNYVTECGDYCITETGVGASAGAGGEISECIKHCQDAYRKCKYPPSSSCPAPEGA